MNLVYLGPTTYSILHNTHRPSSEASNSTLTAATTRSTHTVPQCQRKTICRSSSHGREWTSKKDCAHGCNNKGEKQGKRPQTLSESRSQNYGIQTSTSTATTCMLRSSCQLINYHSLNDGPDYVTPPSPKRHRKRIHQPRNAPSATRVAAQCSYSTPEAQEAVTQKLSGIPKDSIGNTEAVTGFSGILTTTASVHFNADKLPDLVTDMADPAQSTEEELEAANILLSLGDPRDDTLEGDENAQLMPIGGPSNVVDANSVPIKLDQLNVDSVIANIVQDESLAEGNDSTVKADVSTAKADDSSKTRVDDEELEEGEGEEKQSQVTRPSSATQTQGSLKIKTHVFKKKASVKHAYKCTVCGTTRSSVQLIS